MPANKAQVLARERVWTKRAGAAAIVGALLALAGFVLLRSALTGDANFEGLEEAHANSGSVWAAGITTCIGTALLVVPLLFLFNAARARSDRMKGQLLGLVVLGPLLLGIAGIMLAAGTQEAATNYLDGKSKVTLSPKEAEKECKEDEEKEGKKEFEEEFPAAGGKSSFEACETKKFEEDKASNSIKDASLVSFAQFFGLAGGLALVVAMIYTCLNAMRVGLLTRFWGSLGMAVGIAALIGFSPIMLLWFIYFGLLLLGLLPGGRPPAWEEGEAMPWPTAGEKAAETLQGPDPEEGPDPGEPVEAPELPPGPEPDDDGGEGPDDDGGGERRKRKKRG